MLLLHGAKSPLDASFTIPGIGLVISVRGLMQTLCAAADIDKDLCALIGKSPENACKLLVDKGDAWLKKRVHEAFDQMIAAVLEGVDCQQKDWKEVVIDSLDITFSDNGISVEIDPSAIIQAVICAIARKAISAAFDQPVAVAVRALKKACAELSTAKQPEPFIRTKPMTAAEKALLASQLDALYQKVDKAASTIATREIVKVTPASSTWWADSASTPNVPPKAPPKAPKQPTPTPKKSYKVAWIAGGSVIAATGAWFFLRRKSR